MKAISDISCVSSYAKKPYIEQEGHVHYSNKSRIYYFNKKSNDQERAFDRLYRDLQCATRFNDSSKLISDKALIMLSNIINMLVKSENKAICVNHEFLSDITATSTDQNLNLLKQLQDFITFKYYTRVSFEGRKYQYHYIINFTDDGEYRAENPSLFYTIDSRINLATRGKKFGHIAEKIRPSYIDIKDIERKEETVLVGNKRAREAKKEIVQESELSPCATGFLTEPAQDSILLERAKVVTSCNHFGKPKFLTESEEKAIHTERMQRVANDDQGGFVRLLPKITENENNGEVIQSTVETPVRINANEGVITQDETDVFITKEGIIMNQEEKTEINDVQTNKMLLSKAIFTVFGERAANEIQDNCEFEEVAFDKVAIKLASGASFNDIEKAKIRKCIQSVYGEDVKLVSVKTQVIETVNQNTVEKSSVVNSTVATNSYWPRLRVGLIKVLLRRHEEKYAQHIVKNWFDKLQVGAESTRDKLILVGSSFVVNWINGNYMSPLEQAVEDGNFKVELCVEGNTERPILISKKLINQGK